MPENSLLLKLAGPLQAWGAQSRFRERETNSEPTKSGVIGLISSALGRSRETPVDDLNSGLFFAVRTDQPGVLLRDYQTAKPLTGSGNAQLSTRYYLSDACFVVALGGELSLLNRIEYALRNPHYAPFLGRRSCPANVDLVLGIREGSAREALTTEPWHAAHHYRTVQPTNVTLTIVSDASEGENADSVKDLALSYSPKHRDYAWRSTVRLTTRRENPDGRYRATTSDPYFTEVEAS